MSLQRDVRLEDRSQRRYRRELDYATTCPTTDKSSRICVRVTCSGDRDRGRCFQCWIPENCQVRPRSKIVIHVEPKETKSFKISMVTVQPAPSSPSEEEDLEGLTPLRFSFKCESTIGEARAQDQKDSPGGAIGCETVIKTTHLSLTINHEYRKKRKGGGLLIVYLKRRGEEIEVITVDEKYLPNLDLEE